jgi:hypothetical protein
LESICIPSSVQYLDCQCFLHCLSLSSYTSPAQSSLGLKVKHFTILSHWNPFVFRPPSKLSAGNVFMVGRLSHR